VTADTDDDLRAAARVEDESAGEHEGERMSRSASVD
jgi:hypothetical protein